jgi:hypothetical protein
MLRTSSLAGYQLLMLNDFTGQSEALVGMLDPFWESKGVITAQDVRYWNAPTVVLARFAKFVWTSQETFRAQLQVAHYGPADITGGVLRWSLATESGNVMAQGKRTVASVPVGGIVSLDSVTVPLAACQKPAALRLTTRFEQVENQWNLWVYPVAPRESEPGGFLVTKVLDDPAMAGLRNGAKVLLLTHGLRNSHAAKAGFESVYWSAGWWGNKFSSLGILCDPKHPALAEFPTEGWSDWQWRDLCLGATTLLLEGAPRGFRPIVQPVPDFHFNALLAHVFEARVGSGALVVCGYDLASNLETRPAAKQFRRSLFRYLNNPAFRPAQQVPVEWVEHMFAPSGLARRGATVIRVNSEDSRNGNVAVNAIDGDPSTFWHTQWQPQTDPMPHEMVIRFGRELTLKGIAYLPRQDQTNGRIADVEVYCSSEVDNWGPPLAIATWPNTDSLQQVKFPSLVKARYLKLVVKSEVNGNAFAAVAELDVIE